MNLTDSRHWLAGSLIVLAGLGLGSATQADTGLGRVYLSGCVNKVGAIEIPASGTLTVLRAIILDGGETAGADMRKVRIVRKKADGTSEVVMVDLAEVLAKGDLAKDVPVQAGDIIVVPQRVQNY